MVASIFVISVLSFEYQTEPSSPITRFRLKPYSTGGNFGLNPNLYTFPAQYNISTPSYSATLEMLQAPPSNEIVPGYTLLNSVALSYLNSTAKFPYSAVSFYVQNAKLAIGNYSTKMYHYFGNGPGTARGITFEIDGNNIINYDTAGQNYTATYCVTVVPVLYIGLLHFNESPVTLNLSTGYLWFHIARIGVT